MSAGIAATSPGLGKGSTFMVTLPISEGWLSEQDDESFKGSAT